MLPFYIPWKHQKAKGLLVFSGSVKLEKISSKLNLKYQKKVAGKFSLLFLIFSYWYVCSNWITAIDMFVTIELH